MEIAIVIIQYFSCYRMKEYTILAGNQFFAHKRTESGHGHEIIGEFLEVANHIREK